MTEDDTAKLMRECNSGVKTGIDAIDEVLDKVEDQSLYALLHDSREEHCKLGDETHTILERMGDNGKEPHPMARAMTKMTTQMTGEDDKKIADVITDGCNMGVKSLHRYLNQYKGADEQAKKITRRLVDIEERLAVDLRNYL